MLESTPRDQNHINLVDLVECLGTVFAELCRDSLLHAMTESTDLATAITVTGDSDTQGQSNRDEQH